MSIRQHIPRGLLLLTAAAAVSAFAASASAQEYTYSYRTSPGYYSAPPEEVIIEAPRYYHPQQRSEIGAPIEDVAMSRTIRFDDLDLRTPWGAEALRDRVGYTARTLCNRMDFVYPVSTSDSPPCYRTAYEDGMAQADEAIARARGYASEY